ncbi:Malate dehydrogenase [NADP] 1, chloroplastic [Dendrobium catenatum]|uniref:Malate dehydrogenase [NADP] 1, chloroplastic n=1 Tax=Dendrobium catenatum TaxID=906689 RepID=A0A2I0X4S7_9ASPA|nr:Malate dehydrogenase [NADP] 1, chloroplastic [Dendrobium catenatum]
MELEDSLYPLLREVSIGVNPYDVFEDAEWALLIGAKPRGPGMERAALLDINGQIFAEQRGGVLIQKWGRSSAASTAVSIVDGIRSLVTPTPEGDWFSSGIHGVLIFEMIYLVCGSEYHRWRPASSRRRYPLFGLAQLEAIEVTLQGRKICYCQLLEDMEDKACWLYLVMDDDE